MKTTTGVTVMKTLHIVMIAFLSALVALPAFAGGHHKDKKNVTVVLTPGGGLGVSVSSGHQPRGYRQPVYCAPVVPVYPSYGYRDMGRQMRQAELDRQRFERDSLQSWYRSEKDRLNFDYRSQKDQIGNWYREQKDLLRGQPEPLNQLNFDYQGQMAQLNVDHQVQLDQLSRSYQLRLNAIYR